MSNDNTDYALKAEIEQETNESNVEILGAVQFKANVLTGDDTYEWFLDGDKINGFLGNAFNGENPQIEVFGDGNLVFQTKLKTGERLYFKADATVETTDALRWKSEGQGGRGRFRAEDSLHVFFTERSAGSGDWQRVEISTENTSQTDGPASGWFFYSVHVTKWRSA